MLFYPFYSTQKSHGQSQFPQKPMVSLIQGLNQVPLRPHTLALPLAQNLTKALKNLPLISKKDCRYEIVRNFKAIAVKLPKSRVLRFLQ